MSRNRFQMFVSIMLVAITNACTPAANSNGVLVSKTRLTELQNKEQIADAATDGALAAEQSKSPSAKATGDKAPTDSATASSIVPPTPPPANTPPPIASNTTPPVKRQMPAMPMMAMPFNPCSFASNYVVRLESDDTTSCGPGSNCFRLGVGSQAPGRYMAIYVRDAEQRFMPVCRGVVPMQSLAVPPGAGVQNDAMANNPRNWKPISVVPLIQGQVLHIYLPKRMVAMYIVWFDNPEAIIVQQPAMVNGKQVTVGAPRAVYKAISWEPLYANLASGIRGKNAGMLDQHPATQAFY
ncbi:MAG: hypothetical protein WC477_04040 [Patescibacteria group bacterium]